MQLFFFPTTRESSLGMLVRDHSGFTHICGATRVDNIDSPLQAELKAILFGLEEASSNHFPFLMIASHSLLAIREIEKQQDSYCELEVLISDIISLSLEFPLCSFKHIRRYANSYAHTLAKLATEIGDYKVWRNCLPPSFCNPDSS